MYKAYLNDSIIFDTDAVLSSLKPVSATLTLEANSAGMFTFTIPPVNVKYDSFSLLSDWVKLYRDNELIFYGRVYMISKTFETLETITCEGALAMFNDTIQRPFTHNGSLADLVTYILGQHNTQAGNDKQVSAGNITVTDSIAYRAYDNPDTTISRLSDLVDSYGGYMSLRLGDNDIIYLDWYADVPATSAQTIDFGKNLLDVTQESGSDEIITVLIPYGAEVENADGTKSKVDITSVNNNLDYIENATGIASYGRIVGTQTWEDVTVPANLLTKATAYLNSKVQSRLTVNVTAVDLVNAGLSADSFNVGEKIVVNSEAHGLESRTFICKSLTLNLLDPSSDSLTLGDETEGFVSRNITGNRRNIKLIENINANYATNERVTDINNLINDTRSDIVELTTLIEQTAEAITLKADKTVTDDLTGQITNLWTKVNQNAESIALYFGEGGKIDSWFTFDANKFSIGKEGSAIHSEQDNESYRFVNSSGEVLLEINPDGTISKTVNVNGQVRYLQGTTPQWATRKGKYISNVGINLDDVWIGG